MSLVLDILEGLWNTATYYKGIRVNIFGMPIPLDKDKKRMREDAALRKSLNRLRVKGFIKNDYGKYSITKKGREYFKNMRGKVLRNFKSDLKKSDPKNLLIMFDVPESKKAERNWFRKHLIKFNYFMVQKSVWVGPSPLPKEFVAYVKEIGLQSSVKSFKMARPYSNKSFG